MKTTIKNKDTSTPLPYPKLMQNTTTSEVWIVTSDTMGFSLSSYQNLPGSFATGLWVDFDGQVVLKNG